MSALAILSTALLFGGMMLYSFGFAGFLFRNTTASEAGRLLRLAFPHFYLFVIATSAIATAFSLPIDGPAAALLAFVAISTLPARQMLMPAINAASDAGHKRRFGALHGASVVLGVIQIVLVGWALLRIA